MATNEDRSGPAPRFSRDLMFRAASAYYLHEQNQGEVAASLGVSRPTISRLLSEARRLGIVEIRVHRPEDENTAELEQACAEALGLDRVYVVPASVLGSIGAQMASGVMRALDDAELQADDSVLISSGRTLYEIARQELPQYPGVRVGPTVGGLEEPEPWWQTNELTRLYAERIGGSPVYLYAPALPSPLLSESLKLEASFQRIVQMWDTAKVALLGIGAPPMNRSTRAAFFPSDEQAMRESVGDICSRFFDADGRLVSYDGAERLVAITPEQLRRIPSSIGVAAGLGKVGSVRGAARGRYINKLVTDAPTAQALVDSEN